jgi:hypothetical protein
MPVEEQVISLYAATHGYLDPVPVTEVRRFERELIEWFRSRHGELLESIRTDGEIPDVEALDAALKDFAEQFSWEQAAEAAGAPGAGSTAVQEAEAVEEAEPTATTSSGDGAGEAAEAAEEEGDH